MARMHSRKHGKSGSRKPEKREKVDWLDYNEEEGAKIILKLSKEGHSNAMIGTILRDTYGLPDVRLYGLRIAKVTGRKDVPEDLYNVLVSTVNLHKHMAANKKDANAKHGLQLMESKIRRLGKYYARTGKLPSDWKYTIEKARLIVK